MGQLETADELEAERLRILERFEVLDTLPELEFDEIVQLASEICQVPMALMSLIDGNRQWFKAAVGLAVRETPRSVAFCAHAILQKDIFDVADAASDARFARNPLVTGSPHIRFYAGAPLRSVEGAALGTICVLDRVPRQLDDFQRRALRVLGDQIQARLELRRSIRELARRSAQLQAKHDLNLLLQRQSFEYRSFLVHDLKNAMGAILPNATYVLESARLTEDERAAVIDLRDGAERMTAMLKDFLKSDPNKHVGFDLHLVEFPLGGLLREIENAARRRVSNSGQSLVVRTPENGDLIRAEPEILRRVIDNLIDNALKYGSREGGTLTLEVRGPIDGTVEILVSDEGQGVPESERERIFERNTRLDSNGEKPEGFGIGLAFCRAAVEAHGGEIWVEAASGPTGAAFVIRLPLGLNRA